MRSILGMMSCCLFSALLAGCGDGGGGGQGGQALITMEVSGGNTQSAVVGTELPVALAVRVVGAHGLPISGQAVAFKVVSGEGTVFAGSATTDGSGVARERWTLGKSAGAQRVEARCVDSAGREVSAAFDAAALAGAAVRIAALSGDGQTAEQLKPLPLPIRAKVFDQFDNLVPAARVVFAADEGGSPVGLTLNTDASGVVSTTWTLGLAVGTQTLRAALSSGPGIRFSAVALRAAPSEAVSLSIVSGDRQAAQQHLQLPVPLQVKVVDKLGNGVPGIPVVFSTDTASGNLVNVTVPTNGIGAASWNAYFHNVGPRTIEAKVSDLGTVTFSVDVAANGEPFDGVYRLVLAESPMFPETILVQNSQLARMSSGWSGSIGLADGSASMTRRCGLTCFATFAGTFALDTLGRAFGNGTATEDQGGGSRPMGAWTAERQ